MTKIKKKFGLPSDVSQGLSEVIQIEEEHEAIYRNSIIPIKKIKLDPDNPRKHKITLDDLKEGISIHDKEKQQKKAELEGLIELAESIKSQGLIHPVIVYKDGGNYRLVAGERRYLASIMASKNSVEARVFQNKPKGYNLRLVQWLENESRKDLSLASRIENVRILIEAYKQENASIVLKEKDLSNILKVSRSTAGDFIRILDNTPLIELINEERITTIRQARELASIKSKELLLVELEKNKSLSSVTKNNIEILGSKSTSVKAKKPGRRRSRVSFGHTNDLSTAKLIIESVLSRSTYKKSAYRFKDVNWADYGSVSDAFSMLLKLIEHKNKGQ